MKELGNLLSCQSRFFEVVLFCLAVFFVVGVVTIILLLVVIVGVVELLMLLLSKHQLKHNVA